MAWLLSESLQLGKRVEALLEAQGFEDADDWGPDKKGPLKWAYDVERSPCHLALSSLITFLTELESAGIRQEPARRIIGDGTRSVKMMRDLLDVRNKLVAAGHGDMVDTVVTTTTKVQAAQKQLKMFLNPPSVREERPAKRERKQAERHPGYVDSLDPTLSCT
jgi:hypothetical protein